MNKLTPKRKDLKKKTRARQAKLGGEISLESIMQYVEKLEKEIEKLKKDAR